MVFWREKQRVASNLGYRMSKPSEAHSETDEGYREVLTIARVSRFSGERSYESEEGRRNVAINFVPEQLAIDR